MIKFQFDLRSLLLLTAIVGLFMSFVTMLKFGWLFAFLVTVLFTTFGGATLSLFWLVVLPMFDGKPNSNADAKLD